MRNRQINRQQKIRKRVLLVIIVVLLIFGGRLLWGLLKYGVVATQVVFNNNIQLKETPEHRINMLILGIGGGTHEGPDLTDTIIFASIDPQNKRTTLVSIPRDLWIDELSAKINTAYATGEEKKKGDGLLLAKATVSKLLNQRIDYGIRIDFGGFVKAVDMVGGLDITIDRSFDDYAYPVEGKEDESCGHSDQEIASLSAQLASGSATDLEAFPCRYEHLHFDQGPAHLDGTTALKFVRSRHALGIEGSDFARSRRQAKVITAFKEKIFSLNTFLNPIKLVNLYDVFKDSIDTDIIQDEYDDFIKLAKTMQHGTIHSTVIDVGDDTRGALLTNPPVSKDAYGGAWVLTPTIGSGNYTQIQDYVSCVIKSINCILDQNGNTTTPTPVSIKTSK